jgi:diadenylate cyclase
MIDFSPVYNFLRAVGSYPIWQIAIELLVIGASVLFVVRFLRGTRGARMLRGIAVVLITLYVLLHLVGGDWFKLNRIDFLYGKFLTFAFYAIVVVFQPELRRAVLRLGETRWFRGLSGEAGELGRDVDALVEAAMFCARRKIGAVIAIERDVGLAAIAESGTLLNADLTAALLNTIFWPNSPLHDLGVVVSNGRIMYAGVQFPMAESGDLEKELGARHRAAVGMSQDSDAVVLVVSEETGDVSIAERGTLIRKLTPDALRDLLIELLGRGGGEAGPAEKKSSPRLEAA